MVAKSWFDQENDEVESLHSIDSRPEQEDDEVESLHSIDSRPEQQDKYVEDLRFRASQAAMDDTGWFDQEYDLIMTGKSKIYEKLDAISLERDDFSNEYDNLSARRDAVHLELERVHQERRRLERELGDSFGFNPEDPNEDVATITADTGTDIERRLQAVIADHSRLSRDREDIVSRSQGIELEIIRLDHEAADLRGKDLVYWDDRFEDLKSLVPSFIKYWDTDPDEYDESSTDEEDSIPEFDEFLSYGLSQRASALCSICRSFPRRRVHEFDEEEGFISNVYHPFLSSLRLSVDGGCHLCEEVAKSLERILQNLDAATTKKESWSIRCKMTIERENRNLKLWFLLCQCELGHPDNTECKHSVEIGTWDFIRARDLAIGPDFLGL